MIKKQWKAFILFNSIIMLLSLSGCHSQEETKKETEKIILPTRKNTEQHYKNNLVTIGDSISEGWTPGNHYNVPYGQYTSDLLHMNFEQASCQSNMFVPNKKHPHNDFTTLVTQNEDKLKKASVIIIAEGTNDYGRSSNLKQVENVMKRELKRIKEWNNKAYILGITPINRFDKENGKSAYTLKNKAGYTLQDLVQMEEKIYKEYQIPVISFSEIGLSFNQHDFIDDLHPLPSTQQRMGKALADYLVKQMPITKEKQQLEVIKKGSVFKTLVFDNKVTTLSPKQHLSSDAIVHDFNGKTYYRIIKNGKIQGYVSEDIVKKN